MYHDQPLQICSRVKIVDNTAASLSIYAFISSRGIITVISSSSSSSAAAAAAAAAVIVDCSQCSASTVHKTQQSGVYVY